MEKTFHYGDWEYTKDVGSHDIVISKYLGNDTDVTIPARINGMKVYGLVPSVFSGTPANVKRVVFSEGLERINFHTLSSSSIQEVVLSSTIQYIDKMGFGEAVQRVIVDLNNPYFSDIDGVVFRGKETNKELVFFPSGRSGIYKIPDGTTQINFYAFYTSVNLEKVIIPDSVVFLDNFSFINCPKLRSVRLSPNIGELRESAFYNCPELSDIKVSRKINVISPHTFSKCPQFKGINIQTRISEQER
jgi:hypothetical protein